MLGFHFGDPLDSNQVSRDAASPESSSAGTLQVQGRTCPRDFAKEPSKEGEGRGEHSQIFRVPRSRADPMQAAGQAPPSLTETPRPRLAQGGAGGPGHTQGWGGGAPRRGGDGGLRGVDQNLSKEMNGMWDELGASAQSWGHTLCSVQGSFLVELGGPYGVLGMKPTVPSLRCQTEPTLSTPSWTLSLQQCDPGTSGQARASVSPSRNGVASPRSALMCLRN